MPNETGQKNERARRSADDPLGRKKWFLQTRLSPEGRVTGNVFRRASADRHAAQQRLAAAVAPLAPGLSGAVNWTPLGPSAILNGQASGNPVVSGRITALTVGPPDNGGKRRAYAGAANGGVWFSPDEGETWSPLDEYAVSSVQPVEADSLAVGAVAVKFGATAAADIIYVGTGEIESSREGNRFDNYFGIGVKVSTDGGASFNLEGKNLAGHGVFKIVIDPDNPAMAYAATSNGLFQRQQGAAWMQITSPVFTDPNGAFCDLIVIGSGLSKRFYAAHWGAPPDSDSGFPGSESQIFTTKDWTSWSVFAAIESSSTLRISLAACKAQPDVVYALLEDARLFRLSGGPVGQFNLVTGTPGPDMLVGTGDYAQGSYDLVVGADPSSPDVVYLAGSSIRAIATPNDIFDLLFYRCTIANGSTAAPSATPVFIGTGVHGDAHCMAFAVNADGTQDPGNVWVGTDGGVFQSSSPASNCTFVSKSLGLNITEITYLAQRPDTDAVVIAGCQDNGTIRYWGEPAWFENPRGDGGGVAVDPANPFRMMRQYTNCDLWSCTDGGAGGWTFVEFRPYYNQTESKELTGFYGPIATSPAATSPTQVAFGTNRLWISGDWGATWRTLPTNTDPYSTNPDNPLPQDALGDFVISIQFASADRIFVATRTAVFRFDLSGASWTPTTPTPLPAIPNRPNNCFITRLAVENAAGGSFYATLGSSGTQGVVLHHVWYFDGTAWHDANAGSEPPDVPTHAVAVDPANSNIVYVGTDVGVWKGVKNGTAWNWTVFSQGLPEAAITDLAIHAQARLLRAATYGRGIWEIAIDASAGRDPDIYLRANAADSGRISPSGQRFAWVNGGVDPTAGAPGTTVTPGMSPDIKVIPASAGAVPLPIDFVDFENIAAAGAATADPAGNNQIFVQVHNRSLTQVPTGQAYVLLLLASGVGNAAPALPNGFAARINGRDSTNWLAGSGWQFADPAAPYRALPSPLSARIPQIVEYEVDLNELHLTVATVCAAAFVTSAADQIRGTATDLTTLVMSDKHLAFRFISVQSAQG